MMERITPYLLTAIFLCCTTVVRAQIYDGQHKYDGEHKNEITSYMMGGYNVVTEGFGGLEVSYKRHLTDRWHVGGDAQAQFGKQLYSIGVQGGYRLPVGWSNFYINAMALLNRYERWNVNETIGNMSVTWEMPYFHFRFGGAYLHYKMEDFGYTEPPIMILGTSVHIRPRWNSWNIGLFLRNYDDYFYDGWNINWGLNFYSPLYRDMQLFGEFNIRPAGSLNQLATRYEYSGKLGIKYVW